jgi:hypothetical protein
LVDSSRCSCAGWFGGDKGAMTASLHRQQSERHIERLVAEKQAKVIAGGAQIVCEELPVILHPDDDPMFERRSWAERVLTTGAGRSR